MKLTHNQYGKARVRVMKITRIGKRHSLRELEVSVSLQGKFDAAYVKRDNRLVVATDSMKNTINVLTKQRLGKENEPFGILLGEHFLKTYAHVQRVEIGMREYVWEPIAIKGKPHEHSFQERSKARPVAKIISTRKGCEIESGIEDLLILKTTASGFENFLRDQFTTLPETDDRIFATKLKATWTYKQKLQSFSTKNQKILEAMLKVFAKNYSPSVQATLYQMGEAALNAVREISKINIVMPNIHCLLINLKPFGMENKNEVFVPTEEPHGLIEGTIAR